MPLLNPKWAMDPSIGTFTSVPVNPYEVSDHYPKPFEVTIPPSLSGTCVSFVWLLLASTLSCQRANGSRAVGTLAGVHCSRGIAGKLGPVGRTSPPVPLECEKNLKK